MCVCVCVYIYESKYGSKFDSMKKSCLYLFIVYILFAPVILTSIYQCVNNFPDIKVLMMVIETKMFNVDFTSQ